MLAERLVEKLYWNHMFHALFVLANAVLTPQWTVEETYTMQLKTMTY